jgi:hypothetical protein
VVSAQRDISVVCQDVAVKPPESRYIGRAQVRSRLLNQINKGFPSEGSR